MKTRAFLVHALSAVHAGTGQAVGVVDLPVARMRATGIPILPGSSIKGVLRDAAGTDAGPSDSNPSETKNRNLAIFGPASDEAEKHGGALVVGDARLLALPVRSFRGTFAWVTCPLLLGLAWRDLAEAGVAEELPLTESMNSESASVGSLVGEDGSVNAHFVNRAHRVYLEDLDFEVTASDSVKAWADYLAEWVSPRSPGMFVRRFMMVSDEAMTFLWETSLQIDTRVRIDPGTRTVASGALWTEESLPPETLLIGLAAAERSRRDKVAMSPEGVLDMALGRELVLQFGGKATVGRGRCRLVPVMPGGRATK